MPRESEAARRRESTQLSLGVTASAQERFSIVLADPPWSYAHSRLGRLSPGRHYPTLSVEQIAGIPVESLVARDSLLFLWATPPLLEDGLRVLTAWGFQYVTCAVWDKECLGPGYHFRQQHELILVGKRGKPGTPATAAKARSVFRARRGKHSAKPVQVHEYIERAYPHRPKLELFARHPRADWAVWGNQLESSVQLPNPAAGGVVQTVLPLGT